MSLVICFQDAANSRPGPNNVMPIAAKHLGLRFFGRLDYLRMTVGTPIGSAVYPQ